MPRKARRFLALFAAAGALIAVSAPAIANTTYSSYSTTVGFGVRPYGYSDYQTKAVGGATGTLKSSNVGGSYVLSARTNSSKRVGTWTGYTVSDGTKHELLNSHTAGEKVRLQLKNRPQTTVSVQASGTWRAY